MLYSCGMCRHLAYLGPSVTLAALLLDAPHSLRAQSTAPRYMTGTNLDGFGVGWYAPERRALPARYRRAVPIGEDRSLASFAGVVATGALVAAVRSATPPFPVDESGPAPFTWDRWLFSHNGSVAGYAEGAAEVLRAGIGPARLAGLDGVTDSETVFARLLELLDAGREPGDALRLVEAQLRELGGGKLNFLLHDGERIFATASAHSLFVLERDGAVIVASEPTDAGTDWVRVPDRSLVRVAHAQRTIEAL